MSTSLMRSPDRADLVVDQRDDVGVVDVLLAVGEILEADERLLEGIVAKLVAQLPQLVLERGAARVLAHHQRRLFDARRSRAS